MKKRKDYELSLYPLILTTVVYVIFYTKIECKPSNAGFWFIMVLGISIGVALTRLIQLLNTKKTDKE